MLTQATGRERTQNRPPMPTGCTQPTEPAYAPGSCSCLTASLFRFGIAHDNSAGWVSKSPLCLRHAATPATGSYLEAVSDPRRHTPVTCVASENLPGRHCSVSETFAQRVCVACVCMAAGHGYWRPLPLLSASAAVL